MRVRPEGEGQIYVPVVSIAYAEKRADNLQEATSLPGSFAAEYSMDTLRRLCFDFFELEDPDSNYVTVLF